MSIVYLIHGFIGSGKTTFAKSLEEKTGAKRFTPDEIIAKRYGKNLSVEEIRNANLVVKAEIWEKVKMAIKNNQDIILDYGFWKKKQRIDIANKVRKLGGKPVFYEIVCDPVIMKQRALQRKNDGDIEITSKRYDMYYERFEAMEEGEERVVVNTGFSAKKII